MRRSREELPFTAEAMLHVLRDYRDVDWGSDDPLERKRQDSFLREWAQMHIDADLPVPDFLQALMRGVNRRRGVE
ncbi:MAG TPA: hypothetical protein VF006_09060 [Longimicrobium sp.]